MLFIYYILKFKIFLVDNKQYTLTYFRTYTYNIIF